MTSKVTQIDPSKEGLAQFLSDAANMAVEGEITGMFAVYQDAEGTWWYHKLGNADVSAMQAAYHELVNQELVEKTLAAIEEMQEEMDFDT